MTPKEIYELLNTKYQDLLRYGNRANKVYTLLIKNGFSYKEIKEVQTRYYKEIVYHKELYEDQLTYYLDYRPLRDVYKDLLWCTLRDRKITLDKNSRSNESQRLVLMTIVWYMKFSNEREIYCSYRQFELMTGKGLATIRRAVRALNDKGFIVYTGTKNTTNQYVITEKLIREVCHVHHLSSVSVMFRFLRKHNNDSLYDIETTDTKFNDLLDKLIAWDEHNERILLSDLTDSSNDVFAHTGLNYKVKPLLQFINSHIGEQFKKIFIREKFNLSHYLLHSTLEKLETAGMDMDIDRNTITFNSKFTTETSRIISVQRNTIGKEKKRKKIIASERKARKEAYEKWRKENEQK